MTIIGPTVIEDTATYTVTETIDTVLKSRSVSTVWKAGSAPFNEAAIRDKAQLALAANATFLAIASPTNPQAAAQIKALTRQVNGLIRGYLANFDDVSDS